MSTGTVTEREREWRIACDTSSFENVVLMHDTACRRQRQMSCVCAAYFLQLHILVSALAFSRPQRRHDWEKNVKMYKRDKQIEKEIEGTQEHTLANFVKTILQITPFPHTFLLEYGSNGDILYIVFPTHGLSCYRRHWARGQGHRSSGWNH